MALQQVVERDETPVMFKRVADEIAEISRGMQEVEAAVGLRGRKYDALIGTRHVQASSSIGARM